MWIEWIEVEVEPAEQARFLAADEAVWTRFLAEQPGFVSKEVWRDGDDPQRLALVVTWRRRQDPERVSRAALEEREREMERRVGAVPQRSLRGFEPLAQPASAP